MTKKVEIKEVTKASDHQKPKPHNVAATDDSAYAAHIARRHGRPCESSAVFETWAQH
jgi:hypothetical protein